MQLVVYNWFMQKQFGFAPLFRADSRVLILGSFPSVKSRQQQFYYGNKQNRFWKLLQSVFGGSIESVEDKQRLCLDNGIALWDIVVSCEISGSMDSDIKNYTLADLSLVLDNASIEKILCNGEKSYRLTKSVYNGSIPVVKLPSTSPANVRFDPTLWTNQLKKDK